MEKSHCVLSDWFLSSLTNWNHQTVAEQQTKAGIQLILASDDGRFDFEQAHHSAEAEQQQQQQHLSTAATPFPTDLGGKFLHRPVKLSPLKPRCRLLRLSCHGESAAVLTWTLARPVLRGRSLSGTKRPAGASSLAGRRRAEKHLGLNLV